MKIAILFNQKGIETVSVLSSDPRERSRGLLFCEEISNEISDFEEAIKRRLKSKIGGYFEDEEQVRN